MKDIRVLCKKLYVTLYSFFGIIIIIHALNRYKTIDNETIKDSEKYYKPFQRGA